MKNKKKLLVGILSTVCAGAFVSGAAMQAFAQEGAPTPTPVNTAMFTSNEDLEIEYGAIDTYGMESARVTVKNVMDKDRVTIDYKNYIPTSTLSSGFLEVGFNPDTLNHMDFDYVLVTLTDAFNEDQSLTWAVAPQPDSAGWWYVWTAAWVAYTDNLTPVSSVKYQFNSMLQVTGTEQLIMGQNNSFLTPGNPNYTGKYMEVGFNLGRKTSHFVAEEEGKRLNTLTFALSGTAATINKNTIADLTNEEYMTKSNQNLVGTDYEGMYTADRAKNLFTSGYCSLKMTYLGCNSENITCNVRSIGEQNAYYAEGNKLVNGSPAFAVDMDTYAVEGYGFAMPKTTILDMREGDISQKAVYTFTDKLGNQVPYEGNKITFPEAGTYKMVCSVMLKDGKTFKTENAVICYETMPKTEFTVDAELNGTYKTGDKIAVPAATAKSALSPRFGNAVDVTAYLQCNGNTVQTFEGNSKQYATLTQAGDYVLAYLVQNAYGIVDSVTYFFTVEESVGFTPAFVPVSFTSAKDNVVADVTLENYVNDKAESELFRAVYINGEQIYLAQGDTVVSGKLSFNQTLEGTSANLTYKAGFSKEELIYEKTYVVPVITAGYAEDYIVAYDMDGVYTREGFTTQDSTEEVIFKVEKDFGFMLPQKLYADGLKMVFDVKETSNLARLNVILQDYADPNKQIVFGLEKADTATSLLYVNGVYEATVTGSMLNDQSFFNWTYDAKNACLVDSLGNNMTKRISLWADGNAFTGFTDGLCVLKFELSGVKAESALAIKSVNNQSFFTIGTGESRQKLVDIYAPVIQTEYDFVSKGLLLGQIITIPAAKAYDVLSANTSISVSVTKPDGEYVYENASTEKALSFAADTLGVWTVIYTASDGHRVFKSELRYDIDIEDTDAPKIYVNGNLPKTLKLGTTLQFPAANVFDNATLNCPYYVLVIAPDSFRRAAKDNKYTFNEKGKYTVQYYAVDDYYNMTVVNFDIYVQ